MNTNNNVELNVYACPSKCSYSTFPQQTEQEIAEVETEIKGLEQSLADKVPPMMVAHTRLENRTTRPNVELCRETPQYGMVREVAEIAESQLALREKLDVARYICCKLKLYYQHHLYNVSSVYNYIPLCLDVQKGHSIEL